ncbi:LysR substrate-binding domain-containing protein [Bordetella sp. N]|uniref:LysR substrate-binding domain-containing protein n=1 Tax=Bordetella sp. N TaxID=1746199 RepID=UPI00070A0C74|nr:LysR substrate-binding domain-containing protein [Bordetella sp. N]ALM84155.1 LysR family transcriptional regulator [Bordetella sp. N]
MKNGRQVGDESGEFFRSRVRLRHLQCFVIVAQTGHLGRAGAQLGLTQPAVSKTLTELEDMVSVRLMTRQRAGTSLTADGMRFLRHALRIMEGLDAASESVTGTAGRAVACVRIGALPSIVPALLFDVVKAFRQRYPDVGLTVRSDMNRMLIDSLKADVFDLVLGRMDDPAAMEGLWFESLGPEPLLFAVRSGHPLTRASAGLTEALRWPLVIPAQGSIPRHSLESLLARHGLSLPQGCLETADAYLGSLLARTTDSIWAAPTSAIRRLANEGVLAILPIATQGTEEPIGLLRRADRALDMSAEAFAREVRAIAGTAREAGEGNA